MCGTSGETARGSPKTGGFPAIGTTQILPSAIAPTCVPLGESASPHVAAGRLDDARLREPDRREIDARARERERRDERDRGRRSARDRDPPESAVRRVDERVPLGVQRTRRHVELTAAAGTWGRPVSDPAASGVET